MKEREGGKDAERRTGAGKKLTEAEILETTEVRKWGSKGEINKIISFNIIDSSTANEFTEINLSLRQIYENAPKEE